MEQQQPRGNAIPTDWVRMERSKHADEINDGLLGYAVAVAVAAPGFSRAPGGQGGSHELVEEARGEDEQSVEAED